MLYILSAPSTPMTPKTASINSTPESAKSTSTCSSNEKTQTKNTLYGEISKKKLLTLAKRT